MARANVWAQAKVGESETDPAISSAPNSAYAVDSSETAYIKAFGWAPSLVISGSGTDTPSGQRIGSIPRADFRPQPQRPPDEFWQTIDADQEYREQETRQNATGWPIVKTFKTAAPDPRRNPPAESRPTQWMGPRTYSFTRPFDQYNRTHAGDPPTGSKRQFNGWHFSMASFRRTYDILGMAPRRTSRNTYRMEPEPWDTSRVDMPPDYSTPSTTIRSVDVPAPSRSFRL